jgi:hypothetical protein
MEDHQHFSYAPFLPSSGERSVGPDKRRNRRLEIRCKAGQLDEIATYRDL